MQQQQQTAMVVPQDALDAQRMNRDHWEIVDMQTSAKNKAADLGDRLIAKKAELKHGEFTKWIEANCVFTVRHARRYIKVAEAKRTRVSVFNACTSIREVLDLGKKPKTAPAKVEPTEEDLKTIGNLQALAERGATEGERESAQAKLDAYTSAFGDKKEEVAEKAEKDRELRDKMEPDSVIVHKLQLSMKSKGVDWAVERLLEAMLNDDELFKKILPELMKQKEER